MTVETNDELIGGESRAGRDPRRIRLDISGMTCASCAARIERRLNRLDGVTASVNYATATAAVAYPDSLAPEELISVVRKTGYGATPASSREPGPSSPDSANESASTNKPAQGTSATAPENGDAGGSTGDAASTDLARRLIISAVLAVPVVLLAMIPALQFTNWQWVSLMLATPVVVVGGRPFHRAAWLNLRHGAATMDTLVSLGTLAAYGWSLYALLFGGAGEPGMRMTFALTGDSHGGREIYLEVAAAVTIFLLLGRLLEERARRASGAALRSLLDLGAQEVSLLRGGVEELIPIGELRVGDVFVARPGERIATDGVVVAGASAVDASMLTGESAPVEVGPGSTVAGASVNTGGRITVRAERVGADTQLARITALVLEAQQGKAAAQRLADRVSAVFVPLVLVLALVTLGVQLAAGAGAQAAFTAAVAVLIVACPCALGLATPTALLVGTGRGAQLGMLIKGPEVLESTRRADTVVLDKTGTVTTGAMSLVAVHPAPGESRAEVLRAAGAVEHAAEHPIARAIAAAALAEIRGADPVGAGLVRGASGVSDHGAPGSADPAPADLLGDRVPGTSDPVAPHALTPASLSLPEVTDFRATAGLGVTGRVLGRQVSVGRPAWLDSDPSAGLSAGLPAPLRAALADAEAAGRTAVVVAWDGAARGVLEVADTVKPGAAEAVAALRRLGLRPILLTGDNRATARAVAAEVGIDEVIAEVLPEQKAAVIRDLQRQGRVVAMVGDGVNDAAALATADLGLAMGTGTDAAIEASDLTLVRGDLRTVPDAIRLARRTLGTIKANLFWAFAYNVAALPLAAAGLLNPLIAGAAMACSSLFVVGNSLRLRRFS
jgi:P-type Cu+ transporter